MQLIAVVTFLILCKFVTGSNFAVYHTPDTVDQHSTGTGQSNGMQTGIWRSGYADAFDKFAMGNRIKFSRAVPPMPSIPLSTNSPIALPSSPFVVPPVPSDVLPPGAPPFGSSAATVNQWWNSLPLDQQNTFPLAWSNYVGSTDGIPATARDSANRANLQYSYVVIITKLNDLGSHFDATLQQQYQAMLIGMSDLWTRLHGMSVTGDINILQDLKHKPGASARGTLFLMLFSVVDDPEKGMWGVSIGNPDTATTIVLTVPGMGRGLNEWLFQDLGNNDAMMSKVWEKGGNIDQTAGIMWAGYDAPSNLLDFSQVPVDQAVAAAPALELFESGLLATRKAGGPAPHITVIGHSYGSVVVGETVNGHVLVADDIILIGSPGVPVDNAAVMTQKSVTSSLQAGGTQVWASVAGRDVLALFAHPLGKDPVSSDFGAKLFESDKSGDHGGYWQTSGLSNMAAIALGQYDTVTPFLPPVLSPSAGPTPVAQNPPTPT